MPPVLCTSEEDATRCSNLRTPLKMTLDTQRAGALSWRNYTADLIGRAKVEENMIPHRAVELHEQEHLL